MLKEVFFSRFDGSDGGYFLNAVKQKGGESVHNFFMRFQGQANGTEMPVAWLVANFVDGLLPPVKRIVKAQELTSLDSARRAALRAEHSEADSLEVNAVQQSSTDRKLEAIMDLMMHQMQMMSSQQQIPEHARQQPQFTGNQPSQYSEPTQQQQFHQQNQYRQPQHRQQQPPYHQRQTKHHGGHQDQGRNSYVPHNKKIYGCHFCSKRKIPSPFHFERDCEMANAAIDKISSQ